MKGKRPEVAVEIDGDDVLIRLRAPDIAKGLMAYAAATGEPLALIWEGYETDAAKSARRLFGRLPFLSDIERAGLCMEAAFNEFGGRCRDWIGASDTANCAEDLTEDFFKPEDVALGKWPSELAAAATRAALAGDYAGSREMVREICRLTGFDQEPTYEEIGKREAKDAVRRATPSTGSRNRG